MRAHASQNEKLGLGLRFTTDAEGGECARADLELHELRRVDGCRARQLAKCLQIFGGLVVGCTETIWTKI